MDDRAVSRRLPIVLAALTFAALFATQAGVGFVREQLFELARVAQRLRQHHRVRTRVAGAALLLSAGLDQQDRRAELGQKLG